MCARVDNQQSHGVVIARLQSSVQSLLHQRRALHQSTYLYLIEDLESTSHYPSLEDLGVLMIIEEKISSSKTSFQMASVY
jgi:hypothetical protein